MCVAVRTTPIVSRLVVDNDMSVVVGADICTGDVHDDVMYWLAGMHNSASDHSRAGGVDNTACVVNNTVVVDGVFGGAVFAFAVKVS